MDSPNRLSSDQNQFLGRNTTQQHMTPEIEEALGTAGADSMPSESFVDQPYSEELYSYLRNTPKEYDYMLTPAARKDILHKVSWFLLAKDDRLSDLVPLDERTGGAPREELQDELEVPIEYTEVRRGQPCGHVFKRGEGVYRCKNCSMDDTCVLCTRCFQATDHTGHDTSFSVNSGTGGCCDCGDPEAWKIPLRCRHHSSFDELEEVGLDPIISSAGAPFVPGYNNSECPSSVKRSIELTIAVVLEFILETFSTSPVNLTNHFDEAAIQKDAMNASMAIGDEEIQTKFAVVLWNDEVHSFQDVIDQSIEALQCSAMEARRIAETTDSSGRDVLRVSSSIPELVDIATTMTNVSLNVSIRAARDVFREQLSASLLIWLRDLACCKFRPLARVCQGKINNEVRAEISHQLCLRWVAPYRNDYLANLLANHYDYYLPESEDEQEEEDDDEEEEEDEEEGEEDEYEDEDEDELMVDEGNGSLQVPQVGNVLTDDAQLSANTSAVNPVIYSRGTRRRRSESSDSLQQQYRDNQPRSTQYMAAADDPATGNRTEQDEGEPFSSIWLSETSGQQNAAGAGPSVSSTLHTAVGAAVDVVDAARSSLARMVQTNPAWGGYPQHSSVPGAFPSVTAEAMDTVDAGEDDYPTDQGQQTEHMEEQDSDMVYDMGTAHAIDHVLRGCGQQRLDWFLIFDLQLWKEVRSGLRELYMATLMLDSRYKVKIALTFARNYPRLSRAFLTQDRAPEHSVLLFSVQLFTAPTLSATLVEYHRFLYIILDVLRKFFVQPTPLILRRCGVILCDTESFRNRRYFHVFHDMRYLAGTPQVRNWVANKHPFLDTYMAFIGLFQGMNPNRRAILQHVEYEADTWVNAFNVTLQVAKSCRQFAECYGISARDLFFAMRGALRKLRHSVLQMAEENCSFIIRNAQLHGLLPQNIGNTVNSGSDMSESVQLTFATHSLSTLWGRQYEVVQYDVSVNPISFHHPLHWFMAELCQHVKQLTDERARDFGFASIRDMVFSVFDTTPDSALEVDADAATSAAAASSDRPLYKVSEVDLPSVQQMLLRILDYPIRVCVVMAQIRAGLWVRNGYVIRSQSHHYREVSLRENTYDQDIVLIQFFISIWPDTDHILMSLVDRFGLYDWFSGRPYNSRIYEPVHLQYMVEEFLNVLIVLVSERHVATGKKALSLARREIVHGCLNPISYSELSKKIPERLAEHTEFDNLLQQMADFRGPVSVMDFGLYELKDEFLDEVDPYFIHYSRNQREEVEELLRERLKKRMRKNGGSADEVPAYIPPKLEPIKIGPFQRIGMLLHTPLACQVLFYALFHATHTQSGLLSETMVDEALQLIVIALEDGRRDAVAREIGGIDLGCTEQEAERQPQQASPDRGGLWKYALEQGYPSGRGTPMNLLGLVLTLGLKPEMRQWKPKLNYIYQLFREGGPRIVSCIDDYYANLEATPMGSRVLRSAMEDSKAVERRKQAAKARQAAILADFANRQKDFLDQYGHEFDDLSDDLSDDEVTGKSGPGDLAADTSSTADGKGKAADTVRVHKPLWGAPRGACIVCQEDCDGSKAYGTLALIQANRAMRTAPLSDAANVVDILQLPSGLDTTMTNQVAATTPQSPEELPPFPPTKGSSGSNRHAHRVVDQSGAINQIVAGAYGAPSGLKGYPILYHERGYAASTCGHMMHVLCFKQYCQGYEAKRQQQPTRNHPENPHRKEYLCPLCKSLGNVLLPALSNTVNYDPLVVADQQPERFAVEADVQEPDLTNRIFEQWLQNDWEPFGKALARSMVDGSSQHHFTSHPISSSATTSTTSIRAGKEPETVRPVPMDVETTQGLSAPDPTVGGGSGSMGSSGGNDRYIVPSQPPNTQRASSAPYSLSFVEGLAESIPRLEDLLRGAQRLTGGHTLHTFLSHHFPQLVNNEPGIKPGLERLILPLTQYARWLTSRQNQDQGGNQWSHNPRHPQSSASLEMSGVVDNNKDQAQTSTPDNLLNREQMDKALESMKTYQFMYTRLYEVLQSVQRDNHVGIPLAALLEYLSKNDIDKNLPPHLDEEDMYSHSANRQSAERINKHKDDSGESSDYPDNTGQRSAPVGNNNTGSSPHDTLTAQPLPPANITPFLQAIVEQLRALGPGAGQAAAAAALTGTPMQTNMALPFGNALPLGQTTTSAGVNSESSQQFTSAMDDGKAYPFDRAIGSLFSYSLELLELFQRGVRNPPVFDHEDSRTLPSGVLFDGVPEVQAIFMHSLAKLAETHYWSIFCPASSKPGTLASRPSDAYMAGNGTPAQKMEALIAESKSAIAEGEASSSVYIASTAVRKDILALTRLDMLKDFSNSLLPVFSSSGGSKPSQAYLKEKSRWLSGDSNLPIGPFLMQDAFATFAEVSMAFALPFKLDVWHMARLFLTAELVRACVSVGDSLLGEYSGAPKHVRVAQSIPVSNGRTVVGEDTADGSNGSGKKADANSTNSSVPQPWVDAPEARDSKLLSSISSGGDAAMLEEIAPGIQSLVLWTVDQLHAQEGGNREIQEQIKRAAHPVTVAKLVSSLVLPFLRRVALLFYLQYGVDIVKEAPWLQSYRQRSYLADAGDQQVLPQDMPECARLLKLLHLPKLHHILDPTAATAAGNSGMLSMAAGWLRDLRMFRHRHSSPMSLGAGYTMAIPMNMPTLYSLVELPDRFEVLFERSAKAFCPRCNGVPSDPALCLLCGSFVCAQSFCCVEDGIGECNMHMKTCGGTVGVFLLVKKCGLLLLHHDNGCFMSAPYLDQHGEVDLGLKRGRPLFINRTRYEEIRKIVLGQKIPVFVARKIDQAFDIGGWVSL